MFGWLSLLCPAARSPAIAGEYPYEAPACHLSHDPDALLAMVRILSGFHLDVGTGG